VSRHGSNSERELVSAAEINTALSTGWRRRQRPPNAAEVIMAVARYPGSKAGCFAEERHLQGFDRCETPLS